jgi:hypothetical protein
VHVVLFWLIFQITLLIQRLERETGCYTLLRG